MAQELNEHSELLVLPIVSHFAAGSVGSEPEYSIPPICLIPVYLPFPTIPLGYHGMPKDSFDPTTSRSNS